MPTQIRFVTAMLSCCLDTNMQKMTHPPIRIKILHTNVNRKKKNGVREMIGLDYI